MAENMAGNPQRSAMVPEAKPPMKLPRPLVSESKPKILPLSCSPADSPASMPTSAKPKPPHNQSSAVSTLKLQTLSTRPSNQARGMPAKPARIMGAFLC